MHRDESRGSVGHLTAPSTHIWDSLWVRKRFLGLYKAYYRMFGGRTKGGVGRDQGGLWRSKHRKIDEGLKRDGRM